MLEGLAPGQARQPVTTLGHEGTHPVAVDPGVLAQRPPDGLLSLTLCNGIVVDTLMDLEPDE